MTHTLITVLQISPAVIWPKYCRYGVKHYIINPSINQSNILPSQSDSQTTTANLTRNERKNCTLKIRILLLMLLLHIAILSLTHIPLNKTSGSDSSLFYSFNLMWPRDCRYCVKHQTNNQSILIHQSANQNVHKSN